MWRRGIAILWTRLNFFTRASSSSAPVNACSKSLFMPSLSLETLAEFELLGEGQRSRLRALQKPVETEGKHLEHRIVVDTSLEECRRRDGIIRPFFVDCFWNDDPEFKLTQSLFIDALSPEGWEPYRRAYPYVFDFKWEIVPEAGPAGDLLFTDGMDRFLVVEVHIVDPAAHSTKKRTIKRKVGRQKLLHSLFLWHCTQPQVTSTEGLLVTDEGLRFAEHLCWYRASGLLGPGVD